MSYQRILGPAVLLAAGLAGLAAPAHAQLLEIRPKVGAFAPASDLGSWDGNVQHLQGSLALGLAAELKLPVLPRLRVGFDYATNTKVSVKGGIGQPGSGGVTMLALTGDLVFRKSTGLLQPYLLVGGGIKRYNVSQSQLTNTKTYLDNNQSDPTGQVGLGLDFSLGPLGLSVEASDYISRFDVNGVNKLQHDIFTMLGVKLALF